MTSLWIIINVSCFIFCCSALYFSEKKTSNSFAKPGSQMLIFWVLFHPKPGGLWWILAVQKHAHVLHTQSRGHSVQMWDNKVFNTLVKYTYVCLTQHILYIHSYIMCVCVSVCACVWQHHIIYSIIILHMSYIEECWEVICIVQITSFWNKNTSFRHRCSQCYKVFIGHIQLKMRIQSLSTHYLHLESLVAFCHPHFWSFTAKQHCSIFPNNWSSWGLVFVSIWPLTLTFYYHVGQQRMNFPFQLNFRCFTNLTVSFQVCLWVLWEGMCVCLCACVCLWEVKFHSQKVWGLVPEDTALKPFFFFAPLKGMHVLLLVCFS